MQLFTSSVGRKILMAITGQLMVLFVIVHLLGNSTIFVGLDWLNAYAKHLKDLGPFVWVFRLSMLGLLLVHMFYGIQLTLENSAATPESYAVNNKMKATFASENMIWTGLLMLCFIIYHLCHFTARITPDIVNKTDYLGRFDVFTMVTTSFKSGIISLVYIVAMICLFLHLSHGIQSFFQTMGWNNDRSEPLFTKLGTIMAVIFLVGYGSIPVFILAGILK